MLQTVMSRSEDKRLRTLRATGLLQAGAVPSLDRLTTLAARLLHAPAAMVTLVDTDRQRFVSAHGLAGELREKRETPLSHSYCRYVVQDAAPLVVPDARRDERLRNNPAIVDYDAVAYAGFPLRSPDGDVLGAFCVVDREQRAWTDDDLATLGDLADAAAVEVALRLTAAREAAITRRLQALLHGTYDAYVATDRGGRVLEWNPSAERMFGYSAADALHRTITELIIPARGRSMHQAVMAGLAAGDATRPGGRAMRMTAVNSSGQEFPAEMTLQTGDSPDDLVIHAFIHDITGRLSAAAEMAEERRKQDYDHAFLQALLENSDAGVAACDRDGHLIVFNRGMREMIGRDAVPGLTVDDWAAHFELHAPDGRELLGDFPLARAHAGEIVRGRQILVKNHNEWRHLVANARPIDTLEGGRIGAVMIVQDITEAHRAEELRRARHAVAQVLSDATNAKDASIQAVKAITESLGWLCGEYWQVSEDREHIVRFSSHTTGDRDVSAFTGEQALSFVRGEGLPGLVWSRNGEVWWNTAVMPDDMVAFGRGALREVGIRIAVGVPVRSGRRTLGVLAFYTDADLPYDTDTAEMLDAVAAHLGRFVERRWAEDMSLALAEARRNFNRVVDQVNDYVWTIEAVPGEAPLLVYGSPNAKAVFGELPAGMPTPTLSERLHPDDADCMVAFQDALADGGPAEMECRIVGVDGTTRWIWTRAVPRLENDRMFVDGLSTDVTERRKLAEQREQLLEQERLQVAELRNLDRMKDELAAVVIHELRNPVGVIRGYCEMLLDSETLDGTERRQATVIERTTLHLQGLVDDLLDLARLAAGHISIDPCPTFAGRMARDVVENHAPSAAVKGLTFVDRVRPDLAVHADSGRLRQALDNLISNAIKYTPEGGTVTVLTESRGEAAVIEISDTGIGIPAEQYPHLFSRFFRASNATGAGIKGTGLGLAVTKAIVDAHGGTITASPAPAGGTTFTIELPLITPEP